MGKKKLKLYQKVGNYIADHVWLYYLLNYTWGLVNVIIGWTTLLFLIVFRRVYITHPGSYHGKKYFITKKHHEYAFSIGTTIVCGNLAYDRWINVHNWYSNNQVITHEIGHSIQNAMFGPLTLFIVYIPSAVRYWYRSMFPSKIKSGYYDIWFESSASDMGWQWKVSKHCLF